jgi:hypothetical protein
MSTRVGADELIEILLEVVPEDQVEFREKLEELKKDWKDNKWNIAPELRANDEYWLPVGNILEEYAGALDTVWKLRLRNIYCSGAISSEEKKN